MKKKNLVFTLFTLVLSVGLLVVTTLAWFSSRPSTIEPVIIATGNLSVEATLEVQKNNGDWLLVGEAPYEAGITFADVVPSDVFNFRLTIRNTGTIDGDLFVEVRNIVNDFGANAEDWDYDGTNYRDDQIYNFGQKLLFESSETFLSAFDGDTMYEILGEVAAAGGAFTGEATSFVLIDNGTLTVSPYDSEGEPTNELVILFSITFDEDDTGNLWGATNNAYQGKTFEINQFFIRLDQIQP